MQTEIRKVNQEFAAALSNADASGMAAVYCKGGQALPPNSPIISGNDNIRAFWQAAIDMGIAEVSLEKVELDVKNDTAIEVGLFVLKTAESVVADKGKYIVIWKNENDMWKWHRDIWNSSNPAE